MSAFNPSNQNTSLDAKLTAGLSKFTEVLRVLLATQAQAYSLSPIQLQILIFINHHVPSYATVTALAQEFNLTKATVSDSIKSLEQKKLVSKKSGASDARSYTLALTSSGKKIVWSASDYLKPVETIVGAASTREKEVLWGAVSMFIHQLTLTGVITPQRMCYACIHYERKGSTGFCNLINIPLPTAAIRLDCPEFEKATP